ncbi:energy transducer TonB, partial [Myxococcota bacterium]|nr:energy transducer TonB [Myxococcota bacterium]MBU1509443.1 energy transducer TonB [Myxococcota bacterium]
MHASLLLKPTEAFNLPQLKVSVEIMLSTTGQVTNASVVASSGNDSFDHTALDAMLGMSRLPKPPTDLVSDDGLVHVFWTLSRTAPFSPVKNASVRYVRFTPENAIARYLQSGLLAPAWKRLMETEQAGSVSRSSLEAFIQHFLLRFYPPLTLPADALTPVQSMLQWESLPTSILVPYSKALADEIAFAALLRRLSSRGPEVLCALFESTLEYSEKRSLTVLQALLERPEAGCPKVITDKGGASTWASV